MRWFLVLAFLTGSAGADPPAHVAKPERKHPIVHDLRDKPIIVKSGAPKPKVVYVQRDGKTVTGRPQSGDRLDGLNQHLR
jgi:hypothetical protein